MNTLRLVNGMRRRAWAGWVAALLLAGSWTGCRPSAGAAKQEDQNIRTGRTFLQNGFYADAERAFQRALQNNPNSAEAHWQLGTLYFQELEDYVGALYHINRFAKLSPSDHRDKIDRIMEVCRQEIAKQMPLGTMNQELRLKIAHLEQTNAALRAEIVRLQQAHSVGTTSASRQASERSTTTPPRTPEMPRESTRPATPAPVVTTHPASTAIPRTHQVRPGDTFHSVARQYQLDPQRVIAANPSVDPRNLQVGQIIRLPPP